MKHNKRKDACIPDEQACLNDLDKGEATSRKQVFVQNMIYDEGNCHKTVKLCFSIEDEWGKNGTTDEENKGSN